MDRMLSELVNGLREIFGDSILQIVLYGSVARKEETLESDIDIALILQGGIAAEKRMQFLALVAELDTKYERVISVVDIEKKNMDKWGDVLPFYKNIQNEGVVLWKAA